MDQKKIGEILKTLRREHGLTQEELAEKLFVSSKSVSRWETGTNMPDISILLEIADLYNVDIRDILLCERRDKTMNDEIKDVANQVADYSVADKEATAKRNIIASIVGILTFTAGFFLMVFGSGFFSFLALILFAAVLGCLCYILLNSTKKYDEANRKKERRKTLLCSILVAFVVFIFLLIAVTFTGFE